MLIAACPCSRRESASVTPAATLPAHHEVRLGVVACRPWRDLTLTLDQLAQAEDWVSNNAAFTCPDCEKVFLVGQMLHRNGRDCPNCGRSHAAVTGGAKSGGSALIGSRSRDSRALKRWLCPAPRSRVDSLRGWSPGDLGGA